MHRANAPARNRKVTLMNAQTAFFNPMNAFETLTKANPFLKLNPKGLLDTGPVKVVGGVASKAASVGVDAMHSNVDITTTWMKDVANDAEAVLTPEPSLGAYFSKVSEVAMRNTSQLPSRLFAYVEVAKKTQFDMLDSVIAASMPKEDVVEEVIDDVAETVAKPAAKAAAATKAKSARAKS